MDSTSHLNHGKHLRHTRSPTIPSPYEANDYATQDETGEPKEGDA